MQRERLSTHKLIIDCRLRERYYKKRAKRRRMALIPHCVDAVFTAAMSARSTEWVERLTEGFFMVESTSVAVISR